VARVEAKDTGAHIRKTSSGSSSRTFSQADKVRNIAGQASTLMAAGADCGSWKNPSVDPSLKTRDASTHA